MIANCLQEIKKRGNDHEHILIFGCKNEEENLFKNESRGIVKRYTALSRSSHHPKRRVNKLIEGDSNLQKVILQKLDKEDGSLLVCGEVMEVIHALLHC